MRNKIKLQGVISSKVVPCCDDKGNRFYKTDVEVLRENGLVFDTVPLLIPKKAIAETVPPLDEGLRINLTGHVRTAWNKKGNTRMKMYVYGDSVELAKGSEDFNILELTGTICKKPIYRLTPKKYQVTDLVIAVNSKFNDYYLPTIAWQNNARYSSTLKIGDEVTISGTFHSRYYTKVITDTVVQEIKTHEISVNRIACTGNNNRVEREVV